MDKKYRQGTCQILYLRNVRIPLYVYFPWSPVTQRTDTEGGCAACNHVGWETISTCFWCKWSGFYISKDLVEDKNVQLFLKFTLDKLDIVICKVKAFFLLIYQILGNAQSSRIAGIWAKRGRTREHAFDKTIFTHSLFQMPVISVVSFENKEQLWF